MTDQLRLQIAGFTSKICAGTLSGTFREQEGPLQLTARCQRMCGRPSKRKPKPSRSVGDAECKCNQGPIGPSLREPKVAEGAATAQKMLNGC